MALCYINCRQNVYRESVKKCNVFEGDGTRNSSKTRTVLKFTAGSAVTAFQACRYEFWH